MQLCICYNFGENVVFTEFLVVSYMLGNIVGKKAKFILTSGIHWDIPLGLTHFAQVK